VALLAASQAGLEIAEYPPAEVKRAVVGYGRAEKQQVQQMVSLLLGLAEAPHPFDASDALAVAICHVHVAQHASRPAIAEAQADARATRAPRSWRHYKAV
jgi:crossover junction endodeoxyribonuclease RuvC